MHSDSRLEKYDEVFNSNKTKHSRSDEIFFKKSVRFNDNIEVHLILIENNKAMKSLKEYTKH